MKDKYIEDLKEIREIMDRSSRFISLSGLSGITAGIIALAGVTLAYYQVFSQTGYPGYDSFGLSSGDLFTLLSIAAGTLILAIGTVIYFTTAETKRRNERIWDMQTQRVLINLAIPLVSGGVLCLILIGKGFIGMVIPLTLIFYGLALVNASKYTLGELRSLGILEVLLGLTAMYFISYSLVLWGIGFGLLHIIYGIYMQMKNKS